MKSAKQVMDETSPNEAGLALIYIEREREMCNFMHEKNDVEAARQEGFMQGILTAANLLGVRNFYGKTVTDLRYAIQEEERARREEK